MTLAAAFGDTEVGQPEQRTDYANQPLHKLVVFHNHKGDVIIARHGEKVSWLDMSRDVAIWLALELIDHADADKAAVVAHLLALEPEGKIS